MAKAKVSRGARKQAKGKRPATKRATTRRATTKRAKSQRASVKSRPKPSTKSASAKAPRRPKAAPKGKPAKGKAAKGKAAKTKATKASDDTGPAKASRIEMAEGDWPVQAYITSLPTWKREVAMRVDELIGEEVHDVRRAVKWSAAFYGIEGQGWFASMKAFTKHVKVTFFRGSSLKPVPPSGDHKDGRSIDILETHDFDEDLMRSWIRQAAAKPGWGK